MSTVDDLDALHQDFETWRDGALDGDAQEAIACRLQTDPAAEEAWLAWLDWDRSLRAGLHRPGLPDRLGRLCLAIAQRHRTSVRRRRVDGLRRRLRPRRGSRRGWPLVVGGLITAAAAVLAIVILLPSTKTSGAWYDDARWHLAAHPENSRPLVPDAVLPSAVDLVIVLADGSRITSSGAVCVLEDGCLAIREGGIVAEITPRARALPLRLRTPQVTVAVIGTVFSVETDAQLTRVAVERGVVAVEHPRGPRRLAAGEEVILDAEGTAWQARPLEHRTGSLPPLVDGPAGWRQVLPDPQQPPGREVWVGGGLWSAAMAPGDRAWRLSAQVRFDALPARSYLALSLTPELATDDPEGQPKDFQRFGFLNGRTELTGTEPTVGASTEASPLTPGRWHHLALSWDRNGLRAYLDGRLVDQAPLRFDPATPLHAGIRAAMRGAEGGPWTVTWRTVRLLVRERE